MPHCTSKESHDTLMSTSLSIVAEALCSEVLGTTHGSTSFAQELKFTPSENQTKSLLDR